MKSSFCIDLQRFMLIPTKFPLSRFFECILYLQQHIVHLGKQRMRHLQSERTSQIQVSYRSTDGISDSLLLVIASVITSLSCISITFICNFKNICYLCNNNIELLELREGVLVTPSL